VASLPVYEWTTAAGWNRWLLARRALTPNSKGELEIAYYMCCAPTGTSDNTLIQVAGTRWAIEDCFHTAKTEIGLDHYQVRRYDAWYRHITLAMLARTYLAVTAAISPKVLAATSSRSPSAKSTVFWHT
jgi:SRSO17 transposase